MERTLQTPLAVIGPGAWGSALAIAAARKSQRVRLWGNDAAQMRTLIQLRRNDLLPGFDFPENIELHPTLDQTLSDVTDVLVVVPSQAFRSVIISLKPFLTHALRIAWGTKGLDPHAAQLLHEVVAEELGDHVPTAVLSGPTFAREVAQGLPSALVAASKKEDCAREWAARLSQPHLHVHLSDDIVGVQVGGIVKNIIAIAVGISDGMGWGANARCVLISQGMNEMIRLGVALGAQPQTFSGLSGLGDLVLTCTDDQSRNRRLGLALGRGEALVVVQEKMGHVVEGVVNAGEVYRLASRLGVEMPIIQCMYRVLYEQFSAVEALNTLL